MGGGWHSIQTDESWVFAVCVEGCRFTEEGRVLEGRHLHSHDEPLVWPPPVATV